MRYVIIPYQFSRCMYCISWRHKNIYGTERQSSGLVPSPSSVTEMATPLLLTVLKLLIAVLFLDKQGRENESLTKEIILSSNFIF